MAHLRHNKIADGLPLSGHAKLTDAMIRKARLGPKQKQDILWDTAVTGFGLRILAGGSKTFWFQYRPPGGRSVSSRMVRIGAWPTVSLADARRHDIAELAIGHKRTGLDRLYNFDQAWQLRCDAFAKVSDHVATLIGVRAGPAVIPLRG